MWFATARRIGCRHLAILELNARAPIDGAPGHRLLLPGAEVRAALHHATHAGEDLVGLLLLFVT